MGWVKLDDGFFLHPKAVAAGGAARTLFLSALCWSNQQMTDGVIPAPSLPLVAALGGVTDFEQAASRLVEVGLWHNHVDGWVVHDFLAFQQSRSHREEWLVKERERKRRAVQKRWDEMTPELVEPSARNPGGIRGISDTSKSKSKSKSNSLESSVVSQGGVGGTTTDGRTDDEVEKVSNDIADRRFQAALRSGEVSRNPDGYRKTTRANTLTELGPAIAAALEAGRDPGAIADDHAPPDPTASRSAAARARRNGAT
jgi:hypothetical protein